MVNTEITIIEPEINYLISVSSTNSTPMPPCSEFAINT